MMQRIIVGKVLLIIVIMLSAGSAFGAPLPLPPATTVGGELWPYVTTGAVLGVAAWKMWKK